MNLAPIRLLGIWQHGSTPSWANISYTSRKLRAKRKYRPDGMADDFGKETMPMIRRWFASMEYAVPIVR